MDRAQPVTPLTLWRCSRCGHAERAEVTPLHCGERMRALAVEMAPKKRKGCCWKRRQ